MEQSMSVVKDLLQEQSVNMLAIKVQMQNFQTSFTALSEFVDDFKTQRGTLG